MTSHQGLLRFSRPGHLAVEKGSDFSPSVDCGAVILLKHKEYAYGPQELLKKKKEKEEKKEKR